MKITPKGIVVMTGKEAPERLKKTFKDNLVFLNTRKVPETHIKICREPGCDYVLSPKNKNGYCKGHSAGKYTLSSKKKTTKRLAIDFSEYPEVLRALRVTAKDQTRPLEHQVIAILKKAFNKDT